MYPLAPILLFTVPSMLAGTRSHRQLQDFIRAHLERLNATFGVSLRRAPAYSSARSTPCAAKKTFEAAHGTGNHPRARLKANQATLFNAVRGLAAHNTPADAAFSRAIGRCRQEDCTADVFPAG